MVRRVSTVVFVLCSVATSLAYEVGDTVVVIHDTHLKVEAKTGDEVWPGLFLNVTAINGNWLWVSNGHPGWLESEHVVPLHRAIPILTDLIRQNPNSGSCYSGRALAWIAKKEYDIAIADFNEAIRLDPQSAYYANRGVAWEGKGDLDRAIGDYNEAIRLQPTASDFSNRGEAWEKKGELDKALSDLNEAMRLDPTYVTPYVNRGDVYRKKKEYDLAIKDYDEAIRLDQKYAVAYRRRGLASDWTGRFDKAIDDYSVGARLDPKGLGGAFCHQQLGWIYAACPEETYRNAGKAIDHSQKANEIYGWKDAESVSVLAAAYAEAGDFVKAIEWQTKAIDLANQKQKAPYEDRLQQYKSNKPFRKTEARLAYDNGGSN